MKKKILSVFLCFALTFTFIPTTAFAETPTENSPDIGAYEHGYTAPTPVTFPVEIYDDAVYGENNANHIYVSTAGNDSTGDGTETNPFATLSAAVAVAAPGTTIHMAAGVYNITENVNVPVGVSIEGAVPCGSSNGISTAEMTVLTSENLTTEFSDVLLSLHSELGWYDAKTDGNQHISNLFFDGNKTAVQAIEVENRNNVAIHDCAVIDFTRIGVGWRIEDPMDGGDGEPILYNPPASWATGGRFFNNYMKDNSYYGPDEWGNPYGRGALFCCGLKDFRIYNNTIIEDCRTAPVNAEGAHIRGIPIKFWYFNSWMLGCKIHDNNIQKLGSTVNSNDGDGWDFAIESCGHAGMEIYNNHFIGAIDLNASMFGTYDGTTYDYATWIHDNSFTADPTSKIDGSDYEEWAIVLERITQKTIIERNTVKDYNAFVYLNMRDSVTDVDIRYNVCTDMSPNGGTIICLNGLDQEGTRSPMVVSNLNIYNNILHSRSADTAGFPIFLGQEIMDDDIIVIHTPEGDIYIQEPLERGWRGENITIANNVFANPGYGGNLHIGKDATWIDEQTGEETDKKVKTLDAINGLNIENNLFQQVDEICILSVYSDPVNMVVDDNIEASNDQWANAFITPGWHPAEDSVLIDAGKDMGAAADAWNNPVKGGTPQPPAPVTLSSIEVTTAPSKTEYVEGENFDPTGMIVTATYSDASTREVTGYTVTPSGTLATTDTSVEISYTEDGVTRTATQSVTVITAPALTYAITVQNDGNGTASADKDSAAKDETVTLTATPNPGYHFKEWQSSDVTVTGNSFTMPEKNVTVKAIFEADTTYTADTSYVEDGKKYPNLAEGKEYTASGDIYSSDKWYDIKDGKCVYKFTNGEVAMVGDDTQCGCYKGKTQSITVDLGSVYKVKRVWNDMFGNSGWGIPDPKDASVKIYLSEDGTNFTLAGTSTREKYNGESVWRPTEFGLTLEETVSARYVKYEFTITGNFLWLSELCVFGEKPVERGDMDENGKVNSADAVYLLRNTMRPSKYPISQSGDVNGDEKVNSADAVYLLRYTMRPEKYPLAD